MSSKRERPNSFAGLLNLGKPSLASTEAPVVPDDEAVRAMGMTAVPTEVLPPVPTDEPSDAGTEVIAPILRNRKKKERLLSWTVRLPESLKARLERASKQYDIDMSAIVVAGTRDYLDRYFPEAP